jgi:hypothetical protein
MALIIPTGYAQVVLNWTSPLFDSGGAATVLGVKHEAPASTITEVGNVVRQATVDGILPSMHDQVTLASVYVASATAAVELFVGEAGGQALVTPPPNVTMLIKKVTPARGRRGRGRSYWPGTLGEDDIEETGILAPGVVTGWQGLFNQWTADLLASNVGQVVLQDSEGVTPPLSPPPGVSAFTVQDKVATQRRRLRK